MSRLFQRVLLTLSIAGFVSTASAFSLLGPYATWETTDVGYNTPGDVGGPMNLGEGYRWNIKTITYGFTKPFQDYFGQRGIDEINKAMTILNNLPPVSKMSSNLNEFPMDTRRVNYLANSLALYDLKTLALGLLVEELGMADSERYVWTLRSRFVTAAPTTNYWVIMRNFDPATWNPSAYVNGVLYSYSIVDTVPPINYSDASEFTVDPLAIGFNTVSAIADNGAPSPTSYYTTGLFFTGLTRDDVGAIRYLLNKKNFAVESLPTNAIASGGGGAWGPAGGSGTAVNTALRGGVDKIVFKQAKYYPFFPGATNTYTDVYYTNGHAVKQQIQLILTQPDILFDAGDLGVVNGQPQLAARTATAGWLNNSALNSGLVGAGEHDGPGNIVPTVLITFSNIGPYIENQFPGFMDQADQVTFFGGWAAIDGTTNAPFVFPNGASIQQLQNLIFSGGQ